MGAFCGKEAEPIADDDTLGSNRVKSFRKPRWRADEPLTEAKLQAMRDEFWDTEPHYGGDKVIWDALRAAAEADLETAKVILESAGVVVAAEDMTICYDELGKRYKLEKYCLSAPSNLIRERSSSASGSGRRASRGGSGQVELPPLAAA